MRQPTQPSFGAARAGAVSYLEAEILNALAARGFRVHPRRMDPLRQASPLPPLLPPPPGALAGNFPGSPIICARWASWVLSAFVGKLFHPLESHSGCRDD